MYCQKCGNELRDGAAFCPHCGTPVGGPGAEEVEYEDEYEYEEPAKAVKKGFSTGVIIAIIAAAAIVLVAGIFAFTTLTHGKQEAQIAQLEAQQAQAAAEAEKAKQEAQQNPKVDPDVQAQQEQEQAAAQQEPQTVNNYYYYGTGYASGTYYSSVRSDGYLWPTNTRYISYSDLSGYDQDTVARLRTDYVHELQDRYRTQLDDARKTAESGDARQRAVANKRVQKLDKQLTELNKYEELVHHYADMRIPLDLDDGVKVNYAKLQAILTPVK